MLTTSQLADIFYVIYVLMQLQKQIFIEDSDLVSSFPERLVRLWESNLIFQVLIAALVIFCPHPSWEPKGIFYQIPAEIIHIAVVVMAPRLIYSEISDFYKQYKFSRGQLWVTIGTYMLSAAVFIYLILT